MTAAHNSRLFSLPFVLVSLTSLVCFTSFQLLVPTLPIYLTTVIGGAQGEIGLVMGSHTLTSMLCCTILGRQMDRFGRKPVLLLGTGGFILANALYVFASSVPVLIVLRLLTGASLGATVIALNTLVADLAPPNRRGEAVGYFNVIGTSCMAIGPVAGVAIMNSFGFPNLFLSAAAVALVAVLIASRVPETMTKRDRPAIVTVPSMKTSDLLRIVRLPATVIFTVTASYGAVQSFVPLYAMAEGVDNPGLFFTVYAVSLMFARLFAGRLSDRFGRRAVLLPGVLLTATAISVLAVAGTLPAIMIAAVFLALGLGSAQVGLMTFVVDSVDPASRGAALGYFQACFEIGFGSGAVAAGIMAQAVGFHSMYLFGMFVPAAGFLAFVFGERGHKRLVEATLARAS